MFPFLLFFGPNLQYGNCPQSLLFQFVKQRFFKFDWLLTAPFFISWPVFFFKLYNKIWRKVIKNFRVLKCELFRCFARILIYVQRLSYHLNKIFHENASHCYRYLITASNPLLLIVSGSNNGSDGFRRFDQC